MKLPKEQVDQIAQGRREGDKQRLADEFAMAALNGIAASSFDPLMEDRSDKSLANKAWSISDAMMAEREKRMRK